MKVTLNESGYTIPGMNFLEYAALAAQHGDDPRDYSSNADDFAFVSTEYAASDDGWDIPEAWPDDLPLWEYRP